MTTVQHVQENITIPMVHLNGTSKKELLEQLENAYRAVVDAGRVLARATPHDRDYYVNILHEVREKTLAEFRKRDDAWLLAADKDFPWGPTNNLCKWFHVCERQERQAFALLPPGVPPLHQYTQNFF